MTMRTRASGWATVGAGVLLILGLTGISQAAVPFVVALPGSQPLTTLDYIDAITKTRLLVEAEIMEGLLAFDRANDHLLEPRLATNYHRIDERTYVFRLRHDVFFHPHDHGPHHHEEAERVTAEDVAFSLLRAKGSPGAKESRFDNLETVRVVTPDLVQIRLIHPDDDLPFQLATAMGHITCKRYYESLDPDEASRKAAFARAPIGTGPYRLARRLAADGRTIVLDRFEGYWDRKWAASPAAIARVEYRYFGSPTEVVARLKTGEVSLASLKLSTLGTGGLLEGRNSRPQFGGRVRLQPPYLILLAINVAKPELADPLLRQLLNAAVNREKIEEICPRSKRDLPSGYNSYLNIVDSYLKAPGDLRALLRKPEAQRHLQRLRDRGALNLVVAAGDDHIRDEILASVARDLESQLGLKMTIRKSGRLAAEMASARPSYDLIYVEWTPDTPGEREGLSILRPLFSSVSRENLSRYRDLEVDQTFTQLEGVVDGATAGRLYREVEERLLASPPHIWLSSVRSEVIIYAKGYRARIGSSLLIYYSSFLKGVERID
jgi:ABC-type transport system substrate-binding protein